MLLLWVKLIDELELVLGKETEPRIIQVHQDTLQALQNLIHAKHLVAAEEILKVRVQSAVMLRERSGVLL